jgi:hypothetical protein
LYHFNVNISPFTISICFIAALFCFLSCDRIKQKGHQVVDKTKKIIADKKASLGDKIIVHYGPHHPDTRFNKKRFSEFFNFYPTPEEIFIATQTN